MANDHISQVRKKIIRSPAVLVVDVQNDFCSDEGMLKKAGKDISRIQAMTENLLVFLDHIKGLGIPIVYIRSNYDEKYLHRNIIEVYRRNRLANLCSEGTWGADFYKVRPNKNIFTKYRYNAFTNKKLIKWLKKNKIKTLILTGCQTDVCVDSTARSGFIKGYYIVAIEDCLASTINSNHKRVIKFMSRYYGAQIRSSKVCLRKINGDDI